MTAAITPQQADREAAANPLLGTATLAQHTADRIRAGKLDDHPLVQAFAHHAQQARLEERERCASYIESTMKLAHDGRDPTGFEPHNCKCRIFATAIRSGETS